MSFDVYFGVPRTRVAARVPKFPTRLAEFAKLGPLVCWEWPGRLSPKGYGKVGGRTARAPNGDLLSTLAHKRAYQLLVGPVPEGLELDHLCRNKPCFNPGHLEPVTTRENCRRAFAVRAPRIVCKHGHPYPPDARIEKGGRVCRVCKTEVGRKQRQKPSVREYQRNWQRDRREEKRSHVAM